MIETVDKNNPDHISPIAPRIDAATIRRYRATYQLGDEIGEYEVRRHWEVESALSRRLLASDKSTRWSVFQECYTELYSTLPWLNESESVAADSLRPWLKLIPKRAKVFEVGSGKAHLLKYLASQDYDCVATEITQERGEKHAAGMSNLKWHITDGVNLAKFEPPSSYDVVISTSVVEHLHPDDMLDHLRNVREILKPGGCYIFVTPHVGAGPSDVSKVYGFDRAVCMHLKEYNFIELGELLTRAGFLAPKAVLFRQRPFKFGPFASGLFFKYCCAWDRMARILSLSPRNECSFRRALRLAFVPTAIWLAAEKAPSRN
ncbi:class I SAM-dependent methyltransferase [Bradyrhizobium sp. DASA03120]|uniref:class I SAM-dependent methyltransferase n=1 Tax=Bradyrhizobium sp. SMVTL-02 TaxID=3395917 RepID=UPI003F7240E4